jgi:anti-sigma factor RsiW
MTDEHNILSPGNGRGRQKLPEEKLMAYLEGKLSAAEQHEVEQWLADEGMESDAVDGLLSINPAETRQSVIRLNNSLRKSLHDRKRRRKPLQTELLTWFAVALILLLAVVAYIVIRKSMR